MDELQNESDSTAQAGEVLHPLPRAVQIATGRRPHQRTVLRWALKGVSGVKLKTVMLGGRRLCSVEQVKLFVEASTAAKDGEAPEPATTPTQAAAKQRQVKKQLAEALA